MREFLKKHLVLIALSMALIAVCLYAGAIYPHLGSVVDLKGMSYAQKLMHWQSRIKDVGGSATYEEFAKSVRSLIANQQHIESHIFGEALYQVEGISGVRVCDDRFEYGCFHAFMTQAIRSGGIDSVQLLSDACSKSVTPFQCRHGIGHGILNAIGYTTADVQKALAVCKSLKPSTDQVRGCSGGLFMEYLMRFMQGEGDYIPMRGDPKHPLQPCASIKDIGDRSACVYWQPMWWMFVFHNADDIAMAKKMGAWCKLMPGDASVYRWCVRGIATNIQFLTNDDPDKTVKICDAIATDPVTRFDCQITAGAHFSYFRPLSFAKRACRGLGNLQAACERNVANITAARREDPSMGQALEDNPQ